MFSRLIEDIAKSLNSFSILGNALKWTASCSKAHWNTQSRNVMEVEKKQKCWITVERLIDANTLILALDSFLNSNINYFIFLWDFFSLWGLNYQFSSHYSRKYSWNQKHIILESTNTTQKKRGSNWSVKCHAHRVNCHQQATKVTPTVSARHAWWDLGVVNDPQVPDMFQHQILPTSFIGQDKSLPWSPTPATSRTWLKIDNIQE